MEVHTGEESFCAYPTPRLFYGYFWKKKKRVLDQGGLLTGTVGPHSYREHSLLLFYCRVNATFADLLKLCLNGPGNCKTYGQTGNRTQLS